MRVMHTVLAVLVAFLCYGTYAKMFRRRHRAPKRFAAAKAVRPHDELRLTNL